MVDKPAAIGNRCLRICKASSASEPDGWYRLSSGLYTRAGMENRETRRRAVNTLARRGVIDVRRKGTRTTLVRLIDPGPKKITKRQVLGDS